MTAGVQFRAPWGRLLVGTTVFGSLVCLGVPLLVVMMGSQVPAVARLFATTLPLLIVVGCALFSVRGFTITSQALLIHRLGWDTCVSLRGLRSAEARPNAMTGSIRTFGNGGLFSFSGFFWSRSLGRFRACATDLKRTVVLRFADRTLVVTPDDPEAFVNAISSSYIPHKP